MKSGIYFITNTINLKTYIGSTVNFVLRWNKHQSELNLNKHNNKHLQNAWNLYGKKSFIFEVVEIVPISILLEVEQQYLDIIKLMPHCYYNILFDSMHSTLGQKRSLKSRQKMSLAQSGKTLSEETKRKISEAKKGCDSPMKGKQHSKETKNRMSKNSYRKNKPGIMLGKKHSTQAIIKISIAKMDKNIYTFRNIKTQKIFSGTQKLFIKKYNLNQGNVSSVIHNHRKSIKNWILERPISL